MLKETKDLINKRKIAYVYLMHRMFEGNPSMMIKVLQNKKVTVTDLQDWDSDYKEAVYKTIQEEDSKGVTLKGLEDVPSIKSIKEQVLRRVKDIIDSTEDPAKLANTYKILSEFEVSDDKKEKSVLDAINETIKPRMPRPKTTVTLLEKMKNENRLATDPDKKKPGRPKKVVEPEEETEEDIEPDDELNEETEE